jgi:hypothetical protein
MNYLFLINGRYLPSHHAAPGIRFDSKAFADGWHELRAVAYSPGPVRRQGHARLEFLIDNFGRSARISADVDANSIDFQQPLDVRVGATGGASELLITAHEREIWRGAATDGEQIVAINPAVIGPGPAPLHAVVFTPMACACAVRLCLSTYAADPERKVP